MGSQTCIASALLAFRQCDLQVRCYVGLGTPSSNPLTPKRFK